MTAKRNPDRLIAAFLDEGPVELRESSYDAVRSEIEQTRQRVALGPWRKEQMNRFLAFGLAAAAVVLVAVLAINFLPMGGTGAPPAATPSGAPTTGESASPTTAPTATPAPTRATTPTASATDSPMPLPTATESLAAGRYVLRSQATSFLAISFDVPTGWWTEASIVVKGGVPGDLETPDMLFSPASITAVNPDACHWMLGDYVLVSSADQIVEALQAQTGIFHTNLGGSTPYDIGELHGQQIVFGGRENSGLPDASDCTDGELRSWADDLNKGDGGGSMAPGQIVSLHVFDVAGAPLTLVTTRQATSSPADVAELESILDSVRIEH